MGGGRGLVLNQSRREIGTPANRTLLVVFDPAESHERIFEAFHTLGRRASALSTGIGLAIVKKIALAHEGRVWVESEPGQGASFYVSLKRLD